MRTFEEVVPEVFRLVDGRWIFGFGPEDRYTLELEPIVGGGWLVALYDHVPGAPYPELLLGHKIPVRAVVRGDQGGSNPDAAIAVALRMMAHHAAMPPGANQGP